ncbi:hypothetical protein Taro_045111 [Colocasia esculenta]|uniref:Uncharacterized protein n=1 Tax=Colocasia esculenta TaxID=4460 RepID=A0A843X492_COLES|nr:hypothetical protein [Colocasia esculenta]
MPFPSKIQPLDPQGVAFPAPADVPKVALSSKFRLKRLFERQFTGALKTPSVEKTACAGDGKEREVAVSELEPSSLCLAKMVQNFMEAEPNERPPPPPRCGRRRCNCFNGNCDDSSEDELDYGDTFISTAPSGDAADLLRSLVPCASTAERNLLADTSRIVEKSHGKTCCGSRGNRGTVCRRIVADGLVALGHDASVCRSRWDKSPSFPAGTQIADGGEYEYVDVILDGGERLIIDIDFRSEFEIARSTKRYRAALQTLPAIFVGQEERLVPIVAAVSEAARQSLKKRGLHVPPWRKPDYMRAKWLSPHQRVAPPADAPPETPMPPEAPSIKSTDAEKMTPGGAAANNDNGDGGRKFSPSNKTEESERWRMITPLDLNGELELRYVESGRLAVSPPPSPANTPASDFAEGRNERNCTEEIPRAAAARVVSAWQLPAVKPKAPLQKGVKVVTGLASIVGDLN